MDRHAFETQLKHLSRDTVVLIAARAALRVFLTLTRDSNDTKQGQMLALFAARAILTAGVAAKFPSPEVSHAAVNAAVATNDLAGKSVNEALSAANHAALAAAGEDVAFEAAKAARAAVEIFAKVSDDRKTPNDAAVSDASRDFGSLLVTPVWYDLNTSQWTLRVLRRSESTLLAGPAWHFWRKWYQGFVNGQHLDWELQRRVATEIDGEIWRAGPAAVAKEIARIEAEYLAEKAPQAERIEFNEKTDKFFAVPIDVVKPDLLGATLSQVQDALEDVLANPGNGISERSREARVLRRVFAKYGNNPQQIEMGFVSVHKGLTRQIVVGEDLPASEENLALMDALEEGAKAIRGTHPKVAENRKIINEQAFRELPEGGRETLEEALPVLVAISDEDLADDWQTDIPQLINDATLPLPTGAPPLPGVDESMRIFSRAAKIRLKLRDDVILTAIEQFSGYRAASIVVTIASLVELGLLIF